MRLFLVLLFPLFVACASPSSVNQPPSDYDVLVSKLKQTPTLSTVIELRHEIASRDDVATAKKTRLKDAIYQAISNSKWNDCLDNATQLLVSNYANIEGHYAAMACYFESGNPSQSHHHEMMINLLLEAIWTTGDGESTNTAFNVLSVDELKAFIEFHGMKLLSTSPIRQGKQLFYKSVLYDAHRDENVDWYFRLTAN